MTRLRQWVLLSVLAAAAVLAGGWVLLVSPEKAAAAALRDEVASQEQLNAQASTRLQVLRDKAKGLPQQEAELAEVTAKIPERVGLPDLIRALTAAARDSGVDLVTVTPGTATALTDAAAAAAGTAAAPTDGSAAAPAAGAAAPTTPTTTTTAPAGDGVSAVPLSLVVNGTFYDTEEFVARLEELPRALRITSLALAPTQTSTTTSTSGVLGSTITGVVYVRGAAPAGAAPAAGTGTVPAPVVTTEQPPAGAS